MQRQGEGGAQIRHFTIRPLAKLQFEPLRQKLLHQKGPLETTTSGGLEVNGPAPERRIVRQAQTVVGRAQIVRQQPLLFEQLTIRLFHLQLHCHTGQQLAILALEQDLAVEPLAGAIEIAPAEQIELLGLPGLGAEIEGGEIERRPIETQHRQMVALFGQQQASTLHLIEATMALRIGGLHLQPVALLVEQGELHILERVGAGQGADEHLQLIAVTAGTEPHVAHRKIGGLLAPVVVAKGGHHRKVDAGLRQLRLLHIDEAGLAPVGIKLQRIAAAEHPLGPLGDLLKLPVAHARTGAILGQKAGQIFRIDPEEIDINLVHVDRADGQAQLVAQRQYHATGGKGGPRLQRPGLEGPALGGWSQPRLEAHLIALVGLHVREIEGATIVGEDPLPLHLLAPFTDPKPALPVCLGHQGGGEDQRQRWRVAILTGIGLHYRSWRPGLLLGCGFFGLPTGDRLVGATTGQQQTGQPG